MNSKFADMIEADTIQAQLLAEINHKKIPQHIAFIMDGNGRWAKQRQLERIEGHHQGAKTVRLITECSLRLGIKHITFFAFSSENWKRPSREVNALMNMLYENLLAEEKQLLENSIQLHIMGDVSRLPEKLRLKLAETVNLLKSGKAMTINLAINYGSRNEILNAVSRIIKDGIAADKISDKLFKKYLYTANCPDPDLIIRTSGEQRLSNFLMYQCAYSELFFTEVLWPDFGITNYFQAIIDFQKRQRRFGNT
jgi:undecaprenyl diphosphate synthase